MAVNVRSYGLDQPFLMPPSIRDWLPEDHLAFFLIDTVAELDLSSFYSAYRSDGLGGAMYDPAMMVTVLFYAYSTGERSSRKIERRLIEDVAYRVVAANQAPDHASLARFRRRHEKAIAGLFGQVLGLCVTAGLVDAGVIAIDGTKIKANASFFANRKREALAAEILSEAEATDTAEDEQFGEGRGGGIPRAWSGGQDRRERIRAALAELDSQPARDYEARMAERADKEARLGRKLSGPPPAKERTRRASTRRANTSDPHSRVIPTNGHGVIQGYNAQAAATAHQIVIAAEISQSTNDQPCFTPMVTAVTENLRHAGHHDRIGTILADAGYWTAENATTDTNANILIATRKTPWRKAEEPDHDKLEVLARVNRGELTLRKAGELLGVSYTWVRNMTKRYYGTEGRKTPRTAEPEPEEWIPVIERLARGEISQRAASDELTVSNIRIKTMLAHVRGEATDPSIIRKDMDKKLAQPENAELYKKRACSIEPVFGNIKTNLGYRTFHRRGQQAVHSEWRLICTAHNLRKLHTQGAT